MIVHKFGLNPIFEDHLCVNNSGIIFQEPAIISVRFPCHYIIENYYTDIFRELSLIDKINNYLRKL